MKSLFVIFVLVTTSYMFMDIGATGVVEGLILPVVFIFSLFALISWSLSRHTDWMISRDINRHVSKRRLPRRDAMSGLGTGAYDDHRWYDDEEKWGCGEGDGGTGGGGDGGSGGGD